MIFLHVSDDRVWCEDIFGSTFVKSLISFQRRAHAEAQRILWCLLKTDSSAWFFLSVTPHTPLSSPPERIRISKSLLSFIPFPCPPAPHSHHLLVQTSTHHQLSTHLPLSFLLSLSDLCLPVWFFQPLISCPLTSNSSSFLHCFDKHPFQLFFPICRRCFHFLPMKSSSGHFLFRTHIFLHSDKLTMTIITITLYRSSYYYSFCTLFGRLLYRSSHLSHHSLNGLSPATSSSRSHSCSPSPLSISLGGPAFLPGSSRPQCENWRWRGRRWRRDNHWSRPQSVFLVTNCRASLSSC